MLLVVMGRAQLIELANFGVDFDFFHDGRIAGSNGLDLGVGESSTFEVFRLPDGDASVHDLIDEARLGLKHLPHIGIERAFGHVSDGSGFPCFRCLGGGFGPRAVRCRAVATVRRGDEVRLAASVHSFRRPFFQLSREGCERDLH